MLSVLLLVPYFFWKNNESNCLQQAFFFTLICKNDPHHGHRVELYIFDISLFKGWGGGSYGFSKKVFLKERVKNWFFVTFNIIISYIFSKEIIEIPLLVQKLWRFSSSISTTFIIFSGVLLQRNWWHQHIKNDVGDPTIPPTRNTFKKSDFIRVKVK